MTMDYLQLAVTSIQSNTGGIGFKPIYSLLLHDNYELLNVFAENVRKESSASNAAPKQSLI